MVSDRIGSGGGSRAKQNGEAETGGNGPVLTVDAIQNAQGIYDAWDSAKRERQAIARQAPILA